MPHYANGTLAQVGDKVKGTTYNQPDVIEGIIMQITSEGSSCNCIVKFGQDPGTSDYTAVNLLEKIG